MEGGFKFMLTGMVLIALAFSLMSVWPALTETKPRQAPVRVPRVASSTPSPPAVIPPSQSNPAAQTPNPNRRSGQIAQLPSDPLGLIANDKPMSIEVAELTDWIYTNKRVTLLKEPGGDPHRARSINNSELEIMSGTRLKRMRSEEGWLLVKSPSRLFGWLRETDVTTKPPVDDGMEWSLFPSK